jgi:hypothetical protein
MPKLKEELAAKGLVPSDENAVLFAMFPRETEAFYKPAPVAATPPAAAAPVAPVTPAPVRQAPPVAPVAPRPAVPGRLSRMFLTVNNRRVEATVEELE